MNNMIVMGGRDQEKRKKLSHSILEWTRIFSVFKYISFLLFYFLATTVYTTLLMMNEALC
jgi:hypothetical protein